jgi:hypothetical protein
MLAWRLRHAIFRSGWGEAEVASMTGGETSETAGD